MTVAITATAFLAALIGMTCSTVTHGATATIVRVPLLTARLPGNPAIGRVEVKQITLAAGQRSGRHSHPCPVVSYVVSGTLLFQVHGEPAQRISAGSAIYEPANAVVDHFDAVDGPASFVADYLLGASEQDLIRMLE